MADTPNQSQLSAISRKGNRMAWTVKDASGRLSEVYVGISKHDVERRVVATHYDPVALRFDPTYRELFEKELRDNLAESGYTIVKVSLVEDARPNGEG